MYTQKNLLNRLCYCAIILIIVLITPSCSSYLYETYKGQATYFGEKTKLIVGKDGSFILQWGGLVPYKGTWFVYDQSHIILDIEKQQDEVNYLARQALWEKELKAEISSYKIIIKGGTLHAISPHKIIINMKHPPTERVWVSEADTLAKWFP
jgi:hypothetical protein